ncbi:hypothetical protein V8G54_018055 [Vigna mungo]|uniref:Transposase-associated domain-containing protein n=1 Tax=Vigna mungo TaxID=3915 RepID=A0AAQ3N7U0_VIGMU
MDRSWMNSKRTTKEYERGVEQFIEFATRNVADNNGRFYCPCVNCLNERILPIAVIREHVLCDGFLKSYTKWTWHGELVEVPITHVSQTEAEEVDFVMEDGFERMIRDVGDDVFARSHMYETLCSDAQMPLYSGCIKYTRLGFKTDLTSRYIYGKLSHKNPCEIYKFLDEETWQAFRDKRSEHAFQEIMICEASSLATGDQSDLISPPPRHEKWKRARTKPSGEYTSEETRLVAEKIDDLVEKRSKGSFTQEGRDDILAVAIGRPEHPGYIRSVGRGVGLKQFFGGPTRKIASLGLAIQVPPKGASHVASTKGSCPVPEESGDGADVPVDCELYVDDAHLHLVALDIKDSSARVPLPSEEVQTVGQAPGNFIIWPARLAKPILDISKKTNIVTPPQPQLSPLQQLGASVVTMGNKTIEVDMPPELTCKIATTTLFICHRDICEIVTGNDLLSTTHHLCIERRNATVYGFLDPVIIQSVGNKSEEVQKYLIEMFEKAGKDVYLAPYLHKSLEAHSRLRGVPSVSRKKMQIITPNELAVGWFLKFRLAKYTKLHGPKAK